MAKDFNKSKKLAKFDVRKRPREKNIILENFNS